MLIYDKFVSSHCSYNIVEQKKVQKTLHVIVYASNFTLYSDSQVS